jgi:hypothetical protein
MDVVEPNGFTPDATGNNPGFLESGNESNVAGVPTLAEGKFGNALNYTTWSQWVFAPVSPSLTFSGDVTIDVWIYVTAFENTTYNDVVTEAMRTTAHYDTRNLGLAFNGMSPANGTSGPQGAVCAYVYTDSGYNEIVTTEPVISLNQWIHVVFTRSLTAGMNIYVNGEEKPVNVTYGVQNPTGSIISAQDFYLGHDYQGLIDQVRISNYDTESQKPAFWTQWLFWTSVAASFVVLVGIIYYVRRTGFKRNTAIPKSPTQI